MMINYESAEDISLRVRDIVKSLNLRHVDLERVACVRSRGSRSRYIIARCHVLNRIFQKALGIRAHYIIEVVSEKFDRLDVEEQTRVLIHEILHIPKSFGGGFKHHDYVNRRTVERAFQTYKSTKQKYRELFGD
jgi:predicted metallopeptidase